MTTLNLYINTHNIIGSLQSWILKILIIYVYKVLIQKPKTKLLLIELLINLVNTSKTEHYIEPSKHIKTIYDVRVYNKVDTTKPFQMHFANCSISALRRLNALFRCLTARYLSRTEHTQRRLCSRQHCRYAYKSIRKMIIITDIYEPAAAP